MTFETITHTLPAWLSEEGPDSIIVLSSRARLARNIEGFLFAHRADDKTLNHIVREVLDAAEAAGFDSSNYFSTDDLDDLKKNVLMERHLISPALAKHDGSHGVLVRESEKASIMVNEEDHIRLQALCSGLDTGQVMETARDIEDLLSHELTFSQSKNYGYLTACPTNMGTGLRVSVLIHLPALVLTKEIQRVVRSAGQLGMAVRGYRGEGSDVVGNLFQISNQKSFGRTESEIVSGLDIVVRQIIDYEKKAAGVLMKEAGNQVYDKVWRSVGILKTARVLSTHEFMNLASAVRLGRYLGILKQPEIHQLNELLIITQPGHLQERSGDRFDSSERDRMRADLIRERFVDVSV